MSDNTESQRARAREEEIMKYGLCLDFDYEGDPPKVFIAEDEGRGCSLIEILEEPKCKKDWSWEEADWEIGPIAKKVLDFMNSSV